MPPIKIGGGDVYSDPDADAAEESEEVPPLLLKFSNSGLRVCDFGFGVYDFGFGVRIWGLGLTIWGLGL